MVKELYCCYRSFKIVKPEWSGTKTLYYCLLSVKSLINHKKDTIIFHLTRRIRKKVIIKNKYLLDKIYKKNGVVFITIHADSYTLLGKIHFDYFGERALVVPYFFNSKFFWVNYFKRKFADIGIKIVSFGGAMVKIDPILKGGGSICLFMDAQLPVNHSQQLVMFGKKITLTTGPYFLAKKYSLPIVPICMVSTRSTVVLKIGKPIYVEKRTRSAVMGEVAKVIEKIINLQLKKWQIFDKFLLQ